MTFSFFVPPSVLFHRGEFGLGDEINPSPFSALSKFHGDS